MKKEDILNRLTCLDKTLLAEIKKIFDREEKLSKIVNGLKTAFDALSKDDQSHVREDDLFPVPEDDLFPVPDLPRHRHEPSCTDRRMQEMQENREFVEAQRWANS